jgi:hypothetical protein
VPYSNFRSSERFKSRAKNFFLPARKTQWRHGEVAGDYLNGDRTNALRPRQLELGERSSG